MLLAVDVYKRQEGTQCILVLGGDGTLLQAADVYKRQGRCNPDLSGV